MVKLRRTASGPWVTKLASSSNRSANRSTSNPCSRRAGRGCSMPFTNNLPPGGWGLGGVVEFATIKSMAVRIRARCQTGWTALSVWSASKSRRPLMAASHVRPDRPGGCMGGPAGGSGLLLDAGGLEPRRRPAHNQLKSPIRMAPLLRWGSRGCRHAGLALLAPALSLAGM